jgi:hypothetical protein
MSSYSSQWLSRHFDEYFATTKNRFLLECTTILILVNTINVVGAAKF